MANWTDEWQAYGAAGSFGAAVLGFGFIIWQIILIKRQMQGDANGKLFDHYAKIGDKLNKEDSPRDYFYNEAKISVLKKKSQEYDEVMLVAEMFIDFFEHLTLQIKNLPPSAIDCWERTAAWRFAHSPAIQQYLYENKHLYTEEISETFKRGREKLKAMGKPLEGPITDKDLEKERMRD
jgi:hypothetical protein